MKDVETLAASFSSAIHDLRAELSDVFGELASHLTDTEQRELDNAFGHFQRNRTDGETGGADDGTLESRFALELRFSPELRLMETFTANIMKAMIRENKDDIAETYEKRDALFDLIPDHLAREDVRKTLEENGAPALAKIVQDHPAFTAEAQKTPGYRFTGFKPQGPGGPKR